MPTISEFYGILIRMYFADHAPPHFHALYGDAEVLVDIRTFVCGGRRIAAARPGPGAGMGGPTP